MVNLFKEINKKFNGIILSAISTGIILVLLAILIVWTDFLLRLVVGLMVLFIAYIFLYTGFKFWAIKKEIEKHFKL